MAIGTRPALAKFEVSGVASIVGKDDEIGKMLEINPETKVPNVFQNVYQHAFLAVYLLSTVLNVPPPPSNLLGSEIPVSAIPPEEVKTSEATEPSSEKLETEGGEKSKPSPPSGAEVEAEA